MQIASVQGNIQIHLKYKRKTNFQQALNKILELYWTNLHNEDF